ncbi:MAG TPA: anti-sigma factor [Nocardioidaceae bacterium]|nr:anti-sigma factor [Nocardioidaceae bacterium]
MSPDIHTLSGAYALDAIEHDEREAFEAHLSECEACREEVAALRKAAVELVTPVAPPAGLRERVLAAAEQTPQLPPLTTRPDAPAAAPRRLRFSRMLAAAAAVVALAGGGYLAHDVINGDEPPALTAADVFASADARVQNIALDGGQVRVAVSRKLDRIAVDGADMPPPPANHAYQLWLVQGSSATSLSVMEGGATTAVDEIPEDGVLAVTVEPSGGSEQPTTDPILTLDPGDI